MWPVNMTTCMKRVDLRDLFTNGFCIYRTYPLEALDVARFAQGAPRRLGKKKVKKESGALL